jgi:hypothetical protein
MSEKPTPERARVDLNDFARGVQKILKRHNVTPQEASRYLELIEIGGIKTKNGKRRKK